MADTTVNAPVVQERKYTLRTPYDNNEEITLEYALEWPASHPLRPKPMERVAFMRWKTYVTKRLWTAVPPDRKMKTSELKREGMLVRMTHWAAWSDKDLQECADKALALVKDNGTAVK